MEPVLVRATCSIASFPLAAAYRPSCKKTYFASPCHCVVSPVKLQVCVCAGHPHTFLRFFYIGSARLSAGGARRANAIVSCKRYILFIVSSRTIYIHLTIRCYLLQPRQQPLANFCCSCPLDKPHPKELTQAAYLVLCNTGYPGLSQRARMWYSWTCTVAVLAVLAAAPTASALPVHHNGSIVGSVVTNWGGEMYNVVDVGTYTISPCARLASQCASFARRPFRMHCYSS